MTKLHYYESLDIQNFLPCETPDAWVAKALKNLEILLIDHAHCEKKAASAAMSFMYRHNDKMDILMRMSKIAREELGHFEQVLAIMKKRGIDIVTFRLLVMRKDFEKDCVKQSKISLLMH